MKSTTKFYFGNFLFFGFIGSYLVGAVICCIFGYLGEGFPFHIYLFLSPILGFIPASITGYFFAKKYENYALKKGAVDFWEELKISGIYGFIITLIYLLPLLVFWALDNDAIFSLKFGLGVSLIAAVSASTCANLISEWNVKFISEFRLLPIS